MEIETKGFNEGNVPSNSIDDSMIHLNNQLIRFESDLINKKENDKQNKIAFIPNMMKCFLCEDYCEDAVQIVCCYENFCDKHIKEEIMQNFTCPNCRLGATLRDVIANKKLREDIKWFRGLLTEQTVSNFNLTNTTTNTQVNPPPVTSLPIVTQIPPHVPNPVPVYNPMTYPHPYAAMTNIRPTAPIPSDINKIADSTEVEMTPDEKMAIFNNKLNETKSKTEEKMENEVKSITSGDKVVSQSNLAEKMPTNPFVNPVTGMPYPMPVGGMNYPPGKDSFN